MTPLTIAIRPNAWGKSNLAKIRLDPNRITWLVPYPAIVHSEPCVAICLSVLGALPFVAPFAGVVDEAAMYGTALSQGRIVAHYQEGSGMQTAFGKWVAQTPTTVPPARSDAGVTFDAARNKVVMFGGKNAYGTALAEAWTYDGTNWTTLSTAH